MFRLAFNRLTLAVLLCAFVAGGVWWYLQKSPKEAYTSGIVERRDVIQRVSISGAVVPLRTATLSAPYDGYVNKVFVKIGQKVKRGDPIVTVTQTPDGNENAFPLRAPFSGQVAQILKNEGADVKLNSTTNSGLVRIDDTSEVFIESDTPEMDFPKLKKGQQAVIKASSLPDRVYNGEILELFQAAREQERWDRSRVEFPIRVRVTNNDQQLKPGMSVTMDIITAEVRGVLALRHDFVGKSEGKYFVVQADGIQKFVEVGMRSEDAFEITSGVSEGERLLQIDFLSLPGSVLKGRKPGKRR